MIFPNPTLGTGISSMVAVDGVAVVDEMPVIPVDQAVFVGISSVGVFQPIRRDPQVPVKIARQGRLT